MSGVSTNEELVVQAILDRLASRGLVPEVHGMTGTFQLDVEKVGTWYVVIDRERLTVSRAPVEADYIIGSSTTDFIEMMEGRLHILAGYLRGRIRAAGGPGPGRGVRPPAPGAAVNTGTVSILEGNTFAVSDLTGNIDASLADPHGLVPWPVLAQFYTASRRCWPPGWAATTAGR